jgi:hypothetical protein
MSEADERDIFSRKRAGDEIEIRIKVNLGSGAEVMSISLSFYLSMSSNCD